MYRPGTDPQYRPRVAVPPPPPQGMMNYVPPRQMPPPLHARPQPIPQFSYGVGPSAPPSSSHVPSFGLTMQPSPPVPQVALFVPPLPSELPPPPPASPPPPPPPLPSEIFLATSSPMRPLADEIQTKEALSVPLPENKRPTGSTVNPGIYNGRQQKKSSSAYLDTHNVLGQSQHHSDWNSTYQDTLDDEAGSPAMSDMDMDMEDSDHMNASRTQDSGAGTGNGESLHPLVSSSNIECPQRSDVTLPTITNQKQTSFYGAESTFGGEDHRKVVLGPSESSMKDHELLAREQEGQPVEGLSSSRTSFEGVSSGSKQTFHVSREHRRARLSRWGSPPSLQPAQNERQHESDDKSLVGSHGDLQNLDNSCNAINISSDFQGPNSPLKTDREVSTNSEVPATFNRTGGISEDLQRSIIGTAIGDTNVVVGTILDFTHRQQEQKKVPTVDEFGRAVQEAESDSEQEGEGCHLPVDEFGRVVQKGVSGSESEEDRRASKRKRSYSRSYSRSISRSRSRSRGRGRSRSRSRSRGRSRSRSTSRSSSRSPTRSLGETWRRRQSFSRSPRRKMRWSRSRSRSPQWRRSYSRTPPRDMRWGGMGRGERDWRVDRDYFGRGRRGGRGSGPNPCFHFARGRCLRGNSCRYLHVSRESMVQDRVAWRRDTSTERHNLDAIREDYVGDNQNRGQWRRDSWAERHEDFGARHQEFGVEKQEREAISSSRMLSQEDAGGEPSSSRVAMPPSKGEVWTPRNALEAKDIQDMAYNKALELVGIPHLPRESVMAEELVTGNNKVQVDEKKSECNEVSERHSTVEVSTVIVSEASRMALLLKQPEGREEFSMTESTWSAGEAAFSDESAMEANDKVGKSELLEMDASNEVTGISQKLVVKVQDSGTDVHVAEGVGVVQDVTQVIGEADARDEVPKSIREADLSERQDERSNASRKAEANKDLVMNEHVDELCTSVALEPTGLGQEAEKQESRSGLVASESEGRENGSLALENVRGLSTSAELEPMSEADMDADLEGKVPKVVSKAEAIKGPEATCSVEVIANSSEPGLQGSLEAELPGNMNVESVTSSLRDGFRTPALSAESDARLEGEAQVMPPEMSVQRLDPAPQLLPQTLQGQQEVLIGQPAPGIPILPLPSQGQQQICTGQPVSAPLLLLPPSQSQAHSSTQPNAPNYPPGSMQHPSFAGNLPRPTHYGSYRPLTNQATTISQPLDQASRPRAKYNSGSTGYLPTGGWGQQSFQPRAPTQEVAPRNQLHGAPSYGTSIHQNHGSSTSGVSFYGASTHGDKFPQHHGAPYSGDQFPPHYRPPNPGDQYAQHYRPPSSGGLGNTNSGEYGPTTPGGLGPINPGVTYPGGFGATPVSQHHGSSNQGAVFSQHPMGPSSTAPFPQHPPPHIYRPPIQGSPFLHQPVTQSYGQPNQPTYGASFSAQHGNQNLVSIQQPVNANQFSSPSASAQQQLAPTPQGFSSSTSFMPEPSQSIYSFAGASANQVMQPSVLNVGFSPSPAFSSAQGSTSWNFQAPQRPLLTPTGQSLSYSYPLTTIPPLSGLVPVPQATTLPLHNDQYDPLSDAPATGLDGAPKTTLVRPLLDGRASVGTGTTGLAALIANDSEDPNTKKVNVSVSKPETGDPDTKNANEDVGMVENMSPENWSPGPAAEETETGQEQALSKKSSRGLKMLRSAIADHVKEVLKPTWREGYMSKEAFKTIAKKAVEKVVGNLPSHHIPKSQEKVDQFMKASRPKISKLVQGYVDKYLKL